MQIQHTIIQVVTELEFAMVYFPTFPSEQHKSDSNDACKLHLA